MTLKFNTKKHSPLSQSEILWMISSLTWVPIATSLASLVVSVVIGIIVAIAYATICFIFCGECHDISDSVMDFIARPLTGISFFGSYVVAFMIWFVETEEKVVDKE